MGRPAAPVILLQNRMLNLYPEDNEKGIIQGFLLGGDLLLQRAAYYINPNCLKLTVLPRPITI